MCAGGTWPCLAGWNNENKGRTLSRRAVYPDFSAVALHNFAAGREAEPGTPLVEPVQAAKRLENLLHLSGIDTGTVVLNRKLPTPVRRNRRDPDPRSRLPTMANAIQDQIFEKLHQAVGTARNPRHFP